MPRRFSQSSRLESSPVPVHAGDRVAEAVAPVRRKIDAAVRIRHLLHHQVEVAVPGPWRNAEAFAGDRTLLMVRIDRIRSTVCAQALPGTDDCAPE